MSVTREPIEESSSSRSLGKAAATQKISSGTSLDENGNQIQSAQIEERPHLLTAHLRQYPIARSLKNRIASFPYVHDASIKWSPKVKKVRDTQPFKAVVLQGSKVGDQVLNQIDWLIPSLKTLEARDLLTPFTSPIIYVIDTTQTAVKATQLSVNSNVITPTTKLANDVKIRTQAMLINSEGKCIITSPADPIVSPINDQLESLVLHYFPTVEKVPKEGQSSELSRTYKIVKGAIVNPPKPKEPQIVSIADNSAAPGPAV